MKARAVREQCFTYLPLGGFPNGNFHTLFWGKISLWVDFPSYFFSHCVLCVFMHLPAYLLLGWGVFVLDNYTVWAEGILPTCAI